METSEVCKKFEINLDAFHDGELSAAEESEIELHLASCPSCVERLAQIDRVVHSLKSIPRLSMSNRLSEQLDRISDKPSNVVPFKKSVWIPIAAAAAVALMMVGARTGFPGYSPAPTVATQLPTPQSNPAVNLTPEAVSRVETVAKTPAQSTTKEDVATNVAPPSPQLKPETQQHAIASLPSTATSSKTIAKTTVTQPSTMIAVNQEPAHSMEDDDSTIATVPNGVSFNDAVGFSTDEDGLYDIKM